MEEKEIHLVKRVSKELGLTYKELGEEIGYSEISLKKAVYDNRTTEQLKKAIKLYLENLKLKDRLNKAEEFKSILRTFMNE